MPFHTLKKLLCHGRVGFYAGMKGRVADNPLPNSVNIRETIRGEYCAPGCIALVGFPGADHCLRLDIHAVNTSNSRLP